MANNVAQREQKLSAENKWKVEEKLSSGLNNQQQNVKKGKCGKHFLSSTLGFLNLCIFVACKVSFLSLAKFLESVKPKSKEFVYDEWVQYNGHFLLILLTIATPYILLFLRAVCVGLFSRTVGWPSRQSILLCILVGLLEPFGLVILALKVLPNITPVLGIVTVSAFMFSSDIGIAIIGIKNSNKIYYKFLYILGILLLVGGFLFFILMAYIEKVDWHIYISVIIINIVWLPWLRKYLTVGPNVTSKTLDTGTRKETMEDAEFKTHWWYNIYNKWLKDIVCCCQNKKNVPDVNLSAQIQTPENQTTIDLEEEMIADINLNDDETNNVESVQTDSNSESIHIAVDQWLPTDFHESYLNAFKEHGYENTSFIKGITAKDLHQIGVKSKGHVKHLLDLISNLPDFEIHYNVPTDAKSWLKEIGLSMYEDTFTRNAIKTLENMRILKCPEIKEIADLLGIVKQAHRKRLFYAIKMLRIPTQDNNKTIKSTTWKSSFIIYGVKSLSTFLFCFIFFYVDSDVPVEFTEQMHSAFLSAWDFNSSIRDNYVWTNFGVNLLGGLAGYILVAVACHTNMQTFGLTVPLISSSIFTFVLIIVPDICNALMDDNVFCKYDGFFFEFGLPATLFFAGGHALCLIMQSKSKESVVLQKEREMFWIPGYNGAVLDIFLLLNRKQTLEKLNNEIQTVKPINVFICTTMFREDEGEIKQLLESLAKMKSENNIKFESHIFFDGGVNNGKLSHFPLILFSLIPSTLGFKQKDCISETTPYGIKLRWNTQTPNEDSEPDHIDINIHLKNNMLVKNKKRWSQVMYISYVLDFLSAQASKEDKSNYYILTTDADVMFKPDSVHALIDLMNRDPSIGAVCARTHPKGNGPLGWYQKFEYAVGHWFHKASEHVLGSVLCAPGCFSLYRCDKLEEVLPKYCSKVETGLDFLTKDMGEDRWLCTLLIQTGWRIEYCAASENTTNCPDKFQELYKQRRRWIASTLANLYLLIKEWKYKAEFNPRLTIFFLVYQALLLAATIISPSMVILVVSGGLQYAWDVDVVLSITLQVLFAAAYMFVCLNAAQKTQMLVSELYTFFYALIMCAVSVGTVEQIVEDITEDITMTNHSHHISMALPISVSTLYLAFLVGVFILGGLMHPGEVMCLVHGIWYLLGLPSAYLVLFIYSLCNMTDSSWGTREETTEDGEFKTHWWYNIYNKWLKDIVCCCQKKKNVPDANLTAQTQTPVNQTLIDVDEQVKDINQNEDVTNNVEFVQTDSNSEIIHMAVDQWLPTDFHESYLKAFKEHGYENTSFIKGITAKDLHQIGVKRKGHVQHLLDLISNLPDFEIHYKVPTDVKSWLKEIGLSMYEDTFTRNAIKTLKDLEILKSPHVKEIADQLGIVKQAHRKRLFYAIKMLRYPTEVEKRVNEMRTLFESNAIRKTECNEDEAEFWRNLISKFLKPDLHAFGMEAETKEKLVELRNKWLILMVICNTLWLIFLSTIARKAKLTVMGANPIGLLFLIIFGLLLLIQFVAMIIHRGITLCHYIAMLDIKEKKSSDQEKQFLSEGQGNDPV